MSTWLTYGHQGRTQSRFPPVFFLNCSLGKPTNSAHLPQQPTEPQQTWGTAPASPPSRPLVQSFGILLSSDANTNRFGQIICLWIDMVLYQAGPKLAQGPAFRQPLWRNREECRWRQALGSFSSSIPSSFLDLTWILVPLDLCTWEHSVDVVAPQKPLGIWSGAVPELQVFINWWHYWTWT